MAKIIDTKIESQTISWSYPLFKIILIGFVSGLAYWLLIKIVRQYIINPIFCGRITGVSVCLDSVGVSGDIATILVATLGIIAMLHFRVRHQLIIPVASGMALWGLSRLTDGLPAVEIISWSVLLYILAYALFAWVMRYTRIMPVIVTMVSVIIVMRIIVLL